MTSDPTGIPPDWTSGPAGNKAQGAGVWGGSACPSLNTNPEVWRQPRNAYFFQSGHGVQKVQPLKTPQKLSQTEEEEEEEGASFRLGGGRHQEESLERRAWRRPIMTASLGRSSFRSVSSPLFSSARLLLGARVAAPRRTSRGS